MSFRDLLENTDKDFKAKIEKLIDGLKEKGWMKSSSSSIDDDEIKVTDPQSRPLVISVKNYKKVAQQYKIKL